jgi:hypothetical protein
MATRQKNEKADFTEEEWLSTIEEARSILIDQAKRRQLITYSELTQKITTCDLPCPSDALSTLLEELSRLENEQDRGMLSALVVHKTGEPVPGTGFYKLARELGKAPADQMTQNKRAMLMWVEELKKVIAHWSTERK